MSKMIQEFPLGFSRGMENQNTEYRKALLGVLRHLEVVAMYERRPIRSILIEIRAEDRKDGYLEYPGGWRATIEDWV